MRILTFSTLYPSAARPQHGIFVETRLRKLVETGAVSARVVAPCPWFPFASERFGAYAAFARTPRKETRHGIEVDHPRYPLPPKIGMSAAPLALFSALLPVLRGQLRQGREFDLIDAHYFYPDGIAAVLLGQVLDRPVVVTARGSDLNVIAGYALPRRWIRWAAQRAGGLIAVSTGLRQRMTEIGIGSERVRVLCNGVDLALFRPHDREAARQALGLGGPMLLAVGNLVPLKRHRLMIEALARLPGVELVIAGEGPERAGLERLAQDSGVADRVRLIGRVRQDRLPAIYSAADLLLLVSRHEGSPNVLLESMACGTPVLVSEMPGITDIVGEASAGRIVSDVTPTRLAAAVQELLAAPLDRAATRLYAEGFDWRGTTDGQIALFREITAHRQWRRMRA